VAVTPDLAVDFRDMTNDRRLVTRVVDARPGYVPVLGAYAVVGDDGAEPRVARILSIDADGIIDLDVLPGSVEAHRDLLAPARAKPPTMESAPDARSMSKRLWACWARPYRRCSRATGGSRLRPMTPRACE
jgi:hypothetical protein